MARAKKTGEQNEQKKQTKPASKSTRKPVNKIRKPRQTKEEKERVKTLYNQLNLHTQDGHKLTAKEAKFIAYYIETGNGSKSVILAGYTQKHTEQQAQHLLRIPHIAKEIEYQLEKIQSSKIASAEEIMEFYTKVMRGEEKDQFGLDARLSERIKAGNELAKRKIDIPNKLEGKAQATVTISLDWTGMEDETDEPEQTEPEEPNQ